jgi:hypothetical protein
MAAALVGIGASLAVVLTLLGTAKLIAVPSMRARAAHVGFSVAAYRSIGALELAAVVGLIAGLWWSALGVAAALGVLALTTGAVVAHSRAGDPPRHWLPAIAAAALAAAYVVMAGATV